VPGKDSGNDKIIAAIADTGLFGRGVARKNPEAYLSDIQFEQPSVNSVQGRSSFGEMLFVKP